MNVEQDLIDWVAAAVPNRDVAIVANTSLIASGLLDSIQILNMIEFAEDRFGVRLAPEDMHPDNFESVAAVIAMLRKKGVA